MRLRKQFAVLTLFLAFPVLAQMTRVSFRLVIVREGEKMPLQEQVTVTIRNDWGDMVTSQDVTHGFVTVDVKPGLYRLSITGAGIETYFNDFKIEAMPSWSETVYVRAKKTAL